MIISNGPEGPKITTSQFLTISKLIRNRGHAFRPAARSQDALAPRWLRSFAAKNLCLSSSFHPLVIIKHRTALEAVMKNIAPLSGFVKQFSSFFSDFFHRAFRRRNLASGLASQRRVRMTISQPARFRQVPNQEIFKFF